MLENWDERDDVVAAGSICPVPDCGALVVSYKPPKRTGRDCARRGVSSHACTVVSTLASLKMN